MNLIDRPSKINKPYYECECGRKYATDISLIKHTRTPCIKLHKCTICDKLYKTPSGLKYHLQCIHKIKQDDLWLQNAITYS